MNVEEDKKQHDYNGNQNAARRKGSEILNQMNKKGKKGLIKLFKVLPFPAKIAIIAFIASVSGILFFAMAFYVIDDDKEDKTNDAAKTAILTSYSPSVSFNATNESGKTYNKVVVTKNDTNTNYEISYNNDSKYLEDVRDKLEYDGIVETESTLNYTDLEIAVIGALLESGANFDSYTENELHCFSSFIKAEAATQNLDLRPNSEKESGKNVGDYIENYQPEKIENIEGNEVPGVILVQRTNTNSTTPITLEYKILSDFQNLIQNNDPNARNYFSIDENGNLLIAKWDHILITVNGEYPENLPESEKDIPTGEEGRYILKAEPIEYSQYISQYTMPFEFLVQLLVITEEPDFCMELVKYALDSKIVIDIQEEQTVTVTTEEKTYETYYKEEKKLDYNIEPNIETKTNYLIRTKDGNVIIDDNQTDCTIDDKGEKCTIYEYEKSENPVIVTTTKTEHTYKFEVIEADTWLERYTKDYRTGYDSSTEKIETTPIIDQVIKDIEEYKKVEEKVTTISEEILNDAHVGLFKQEKEKYYKNKVAVPQVSVKDGQDLENSRTTYWKQINIEDLGTKFETSLGSVDTKYNRIDGINSNGDTIYSYYMPSEFTVTTINIEDLIGGITYRYNLSNNYTYSLVSTNKDDVIKCNISKLVTTPYNKINTTTVTNQKVTKFPANNNPIKKTEIYTVDSNGEFVKFLKAYDNSKGAQNNLNSIDSWLYEMMEDRACTEKLVYGIKYLLYKYDGVDRGVTEQELNQILNQEMSSSLNNFDSFIYGDSIQEKVWFALKDLGYSDYAVAAALGNIDVESDGFKSDVVEYDNGIGIGLCQWSYDRRDSLETYASSKGKSWQDENIQIEFLISEISGKGEAKAFATQRKSGYIQKEGITSTHDEWKNAKVEGNNEESVNLATLYFMRFFESPEDLSSLERRQKKAQDYYNQFEGQEKAGGTYTSSSSDIIRGVYISQSGRQHRVYYQNGLSRKDSYWSDKCNRLAVASLISGLSNASDDEILKEVRSAGGYMLSDETSTDALLGKYGLDSSINDGSVYSVDRLRSDLIKGNTVAFWMKEVAKGKSGQLYSNGRFHWIIVLEYRSSNGKEQMFISDSAWSEPGWRDIDEFEPIKNNGLIGFYTVISKK